jgi:hypothetical protein
MGINKKTTPVMGSNERYLPVKDDNYLYIKKPELLKHYQNNLRIFITGLDLPPEQLKDIESQIRQTIASELERIDEKMLEERKIKQQLAKEKNTINVLQQGLNLPPEQLKDIESQIRQTIASELKEEKNSRFVEVFVDTASSMNARPVCTYSANAVTRPAPPSNPFVLALYAYEDTFRVSITEGGLPSNMMQIGLKIPEGMWAKEILAFNWSSFTTTNWVAVGFRPEHSPKGWMSIHKPGTPSPSPGGSTPADLLIFRKPKEFGIWTDMYKIGPNLWENWGGKTILFNWIDDSRVNGGPCI